MQLLPKPERDTQLSKVSQFEALSPTHAEAHAPLFANQPFANRVQSGRVAIFIDGSNLFYAASYLNIEIDYMRLLQYLVKDSRLLRAYFYTGVDRTNEKQQGFLLWMRRNGYRVVTKDLAPGADGSKRANLNVEMAIDMIRLAGYCNKIILVSGDGNLAYAVNSIAYRGIQIEVVSLRSMTSEVLINVADQYLDLESIKQKIQRQ